MTDRGLRVGGRWVEGALDGKQEPGYKTVNNIFYTRI